MINTYVTAKFCFLNNKKENQLLLVKNTGAALAQICNLFTLLSLFFFVLILLFHSKGVIG
jgi:hypothetical protein